jgi:hypothetical protein
MELHQIILDIALTSYEGARVKAITLNLTINLTNIARGVKQGYLLSPSYSISALPYKLKNLVLKASNNMATIGINKIVHQHEHMSIISYYFQATMKICKFC